MIAARSENPPSTRREIVAAVAHRGYTADYSSGRRRPLYPENTLRAFDMACKEGAKALEFDIQLSKDGVPIILHDRDLSRTTNGTGLCSDYTVAELKRLDAGQGQQIPTFQEVIGHFQGKGLTLFCEIKDPSAAYGVAEIVALSRWEPEQLPVISFDSLTLRQVRSANQRIQLGVSIEHALTPAHLALADEVRATFFIPNIKNLDPASVEAMQHKQRKVCCWTCNSDTDIRKALRLGVDGVIGDDFPKLSHHISSTGGA